MGLQTTFRSYTIGQNNFCKFSVLQGEFTRINCREDFYLGGYVNYTNIFDRTGATGGFTGCVRRLEVNDNVYDMRQGEYVGDAIRGFDVGQ